MPQDEVERELIEAIDFHEDLLPHLSNDISTEEREEDPFHANRAKWLKELVNLRHSVPRLNELLESTRNQCESYRQEIQRLKDEKVALADVIADLKMDLKARK